MDQELVEVLERAQRLAATRATGQQRTPGTAEEVQDASVEVLRTDPRLWAAYNRGRADQAAEVRRVLATASTRSPQQARVPRQAKLPRPTRPTRTTTGVSQRRPPTVGSTPAAASAVSTATRTNAPQPKPSARAAPTAHGHLTATVRWVRPAPGAPLHPCYPPAVPHPPTTEWTGMPSAVAYQDQVPTPQPKSTSDKPGPLDPWPASTGEAAERPTKAERKRQRDQERKQEYRRRKRMTQTANKTGHSQQHRLERPEPATRPEPTGTTEAATSGTARLPTRDEQPAVAANSAGIGESMEIDDQVLDDPEPSLPPGDGIEEDLPSFYTCSPPTSPRAD